MKTVERAAYGDFQTPLSLARQVCAQLAAAGHEPKTVVEPTCGVGAFLLAAAESFPSAQRWGQDINPDYVAQARASLLSAGHEATIERGDFFQTDWAQRLAEWSDPVLVLGNPPWVTSADLGGLGVDNLPAKTNAQGLAGLAAKTGKANFDISEWMLTQWLELGQSRPLDVAMLVKTAVARRVLESAHRRGLSLHGATLHRIDARASFGAAVDAGLFRFSTARSASIACPVFAELDTTQPEAELAIRDGRLIADAHAYDQAQPVLGQADPPWRSGIKHDCSRVMELRREGEGLVNGTGQGVEIEAEHCFPLLKSSDLRGEDDPPVRRWLVLPQLRFGEDTATLAERAPQTWQYLLEHGDALDGRRSSIYRNQPRFAVFGLGPYSFKRWKIAISGLVKRSAFTLVGPREDQPVMLDDTCYFIGFDEEAQARDALARLRSAPAQAVLRALVFRDAKRPVTKDVLDRIDLAKITEY
ncbi:MAG: SAM-dependent methyltransferase [Myxococcota bacterium]